MVTVRIVTVYDMTYGYCTCQIVTVCDMYLLYVTNGYRT